MTTTAQFSVDVSRETALEFARLSGDWNPLHTDEAHAARTAYHRPILHGAFSAGLVSRMAGMFIPGTDCLLHSIRLRFLAPIIPPASLSVDGTLDSDNGAHGRVSVVISDASSGTRYVDASYEFGRHDATPVSAEAELVPANKTVVTPGDDIVLVTGASGGLGSAVVSQLGSRAIGIARSTGNQWVQVHDIERLPEEYASIFHGRRIAAIVHCAWPAPDNMPLSTLPTVEASVEHHVAAPLRQMIALAKLLRVHGTPDSTLVLVGSAFAEPGRHNYRMPLYSLSKSLIPTLTRILALEFGTSAQRCVGIVFDVLDTGMNQRMTRSARLAHADRTPTGELPSAEMAASQIAWVLENRSMLASGAVLSLTGGALP